MPPAVLALRPSAQPVPAQASVGTAVALLVPLPPAPAQQQAGAQRPGWQAERRRRGGVLGGSGWAGQRTIQPGRDRWRDEPDPPAGRGVARTGVTVLFLADDAFTRPIPAGGAVLNGAGEYTGFITAAEWGLIETPVFLTSTMQLGRVYDAACELLTEGEPAIGDDVAIPVRA